MNTDKYGSFRLRLGLSVMVWIVFLGALYVLAGFKRMSDGGLLSIFLDWLRAINLDDRGSSTSMTAGRIVGLFLILVGPPLTAAWASPFLGAGHAPGEPEADFSEPNIGRPPLFYWPLKRYQQLTNRSEASCVYAPLLLWWMASLLDAAGLFWSNNYLARVGLTTRVAVWMYILWTVLLSLLPGVVRRILDSRATRRALLNQPSREE